MGAFAYNNHVTDVILKTIKYLSVNTIVSILLLSSILFSTSTFGFIEAGILIC